VVKSSEHGNGPSGFVKGEKSGEKLSDVTILLHVGTEKGSCGCGLCRKPNRVTFSKGAPLRRQNTLDFSCKKRNNPETQTETKKKLRLEISPQSRNERR
jgi:hypothetical protein